MVCIKEQTHSERLSESEIPNVVFKTFMKLRSYEEIDLFQMMEHDSFLVY